ncbi:MAG: sulfotransferase domain-containing protein [Proteobacteria bacterium]|nr:sulfotransferase domain-containing protein [Pseudomonadota bacterium]
MLKTIFEEVRSALFDHEPLVDFLVMGTQKGGTTSLHSILRQHPRLLLPRVKELHFFDQDRYFFPIKRYGLYHRFFRSEFEKLASCRDRNDVPFESFVKGEVTPIYMYWMPALDRIHAYNPNVKMIFLLRNPIGRATSHYAMELKRKAEDLPYPRAIREEEKRLLQFPNKQHRIFSYVDRGKYAAQIERILERFPRQNLLFIKSDDFQTRFPEEIRKIQEFLGVDPVHLKSEFLHSGDTQQPRSEDKAYLMDIFLPDIERLERLTGLDCRAWKAA